MADNKVYNGKNLPLVSDPVLTRGILNKVSQKIFASGGKTPIFGRFRVFLIAVNVFKIFVFSSVTTLSTVPVLKTIYDSI